MPKLFSCEDRLPVDVRENDHLLDEVVSLPLQAVVVGVRLPVGSWRRDRLSGHRRRVDSGLREAGGRVDGRVDGQTDGRGGRQLVTP